MFRAFGRALALTLATAVGLGAAAPTSVTFSDTKLKNGLRVIISEDHAAPTVLGRRRLQRRLARRAHGPHRLRAPVRAHDVQGLRERRPGEHPTLIFSNGGTMNGTTNKDRTLYFETLPANQLDSALFLEADRMRSLAITKANLDNQRNAVQEERRLRRRQPAVRQDVRSASSELAYDNSAYKHSVIGSMADLNAASVEDVAAFFKTYYAPNNAVLAIVGDVDTKKTLEQVDKYFESSRRSRPRRGRT